MIVRSVVGSATEPNNTNKQYITDADVLRNYYPESEKYSKGRGKGEEHLDSLKDIIDDSRSDKIINTTEIPNLNPSDIQGYNCVK